MNCPKCETASLEDVQSLDISKYELSIDNRLQASIAISLKRIADAMETKSVVEKEERK